MTKVTISGLGMDPIETTTEEIKRATKAIKNGFGIGHNSGAGGEKLKSYIVRIERLEDEKAQTAEDIKEIYSEAKSNGFDPKIMRQVVRLRRMDAQKRAEAEELLQVYMDALGMLRDTPLGKAAIEAKQKQT